MGPIRLALVSNSLQNSQGRNLNIPMYFFQPVNVILLDHLVVAVMILESANARKGMLELNVMLRWDHGQR